MRRGKGYKSKNGVVVGTRKIVKCGASFYISSSAQSYLDKNSITSSIHIFYFLPYLIVWMKLKGVYHQ